MRFALPALLLSLGLSAIVAGCHTAEWALVDTHFNTIEAELRVPEPVTASDARKMADQVAALHSDVLAIRGKLPAPEPTPTPAPGGK